MTLVANGLVVAHGDGEEAVSVATIETEKVYNRTSSVPADTGVPTETGQGAANGGHVSKNRTS